ncbi:MULTISPECIES: hypothetical protein [unclassified Nostoc]|uniref:hypothetical protein n=1 Tax=unclassified Nostoc TaxID=2593658 RepID=UPI002620FA8B|nr:hypothetical protein [Nostoc sp. S13]MDF5739570.1 hypothetical protein [Nostoc sp. S13]
MLSTLPQEEITSLKQNLRREIKKLSGASGINNLNSKLERLEEIEQILSIDKYKIVFIGTIGQGKTTVICHLFNLISDFKVSKTINGKTKSVTETKELLSTGAGRTTICEVIIKASEKTYIEIEPYTVDEMENLIFDFCDSIANRDNTQLEDKIIISQEIERVIRNITELKITAKTVDDGDKKNILRTDQAKELLNESGVELLKNTALNNANLEARTTTKIEFNNQNNEQEWIKNTFAAINNVQLKEFAIPRKIYLYLSDGILSGSNLSQFDSVVDTKGLDENPIRKDLQKYVDSQDTICIFVTPFNDAPEANIRKLIIYHLTSKSKDFHHRFVTLVLPRKNEPEKVHGSDEDRDLGIRIRQDEVQATFKNLNVDFFQKNILFYDSLRYYRDDIVKLNENYDEEDVQADKNEFLEAIAGVVERRRNILLDEIKAIKKSSAKIKNSDVLKESEIKVIQNAIQKIKSLRDLSKRVPSFIYEDFIDEYVNKYYRRVYPAWNTKHAIHRNFGYYQPRDIDIYYDARVVAGGIDEDQMLKKFTKEVKQELENILNELVSVNESLKILFPELVKKFYVLYDDFIYEVGKEVEEEITRKLLPRNEDSAFWKALFDEKGKERKRRETFVDNVCLIFQRELEKEKNLNTFLKSKAEYHWEKLITKILGFFGEK